MTNPSQNLAYKFEATAALYSDKIAIQHKKDDVWVDISYSALRNKIQCLSAFLLEEKILKDDKLAILLENRPEWPLIFFASVSIGAIAVPLNPDSSEKEIENILKNSECKIIFTSDGALLKKALSAKSKSLKDVVSVDSDRFKNIVSVKKVLKPETEPSLSDLACILYTSGTTDEPKGVMLTHKNLFSNCESLNSLNLVSPNDSVVSILPLHHSYPLTVTMLLPLLYGAKIIYPQTMRSESILKAMQEANPTVFVAVPQIFYSFHQKIMGSLKKIPFPFNLLFRFVTESLYKIRNKTGVNVARYLFYALHKKFGKVMRLFVSGGAKLDEGVERNLFKLGFTILDGYGLTETSPVLTINPLKNPKIGSVGLPIPGVELRIEDKDKNNIGEVVVRGPNIMKGYYRREDLTGEVIKDGWFHTGDLGYLDKDGYLFLTGRLKEVIVLSSGLNIYPEEIEQAYSKHAPVKEMCAFEAPAKKGPEESLVLWAVVVPDLEFFRKYAEINLRSVIKERFDNVSKLLPNHKRLMGFSITLEELPHTLLGKIKRFAVKEIYTPKIIGEKEHLREPKEPTKEDLGLMESETGKKIIVCLKKQTKITGLIAVQDSLELDLGIDSLGRIELASNLEDVFNTKIKDEVTGSSFTVKDLIVGIESLLKKQMKTLSRNEKEIISGPEYWKKLFQVLPKEENLEKIDLNPGFGAWLSGFLFTCLVYIFFKVFYSLKVEGKNNLPKAGPYILYVNHTSYFDGLLVAASLPNFPRLDLFFVGFRPYFDVPIIRGLVKIGRIIPLDFSSHFLEALRSCYYVLKNDKNLCLFPEGMRTLDGNINEFKRGFGILLKESKVKAVPVFIDGAYQAWPRTSKFPRRYSITVKFGKVLDPKDIEENGYRLGAKDGYEAICIAAKDALTRLTPYKINSFPKA